MTGNKLEKNNQLIGKEKEAQTETGTVRKHCNHPDMLLSSKFNQPSIEYMTVMKNGTSQSHVNLFNQQ